MTKALVEFMRSEPSVFLDHDVIAAIKTNFIGVTSNSKACQRDHIFVAIRGAVDTSKDGHDYIDEAIANGAALIIVDRDFSTSEKWGVPLIKTSDSKKALCLLAECFHGFPSKTLRVIGITGTNGKTSTSFMLHSILSRASYKPQVIGTLGVGDPENLFATSHTTPGPLEVSAHLARMQRDGVSHVIMEVSSHALSLKRVDGINFAAVGFTNLSQDHLDFHGNLDAYRQAKARLFFELAREHTKKILPFDHPFEKIIDARTFGFHPSSDLVISDIKTESTGLNFSIAHRHEKATISLPFFGDFHAKNAGLAAQIALALGVEFAAVVDGLHKCPPIPGRMEVLHSSSTKKVIVDFAHTPDALASLLTSIRNLSKGRIVLVFGCGGERDAEKRPLMGAIAEDLADFVVVTDDNPRRECRQSIRAAILSGMKSGRNVREIADRKKAIEYAIVSAHDSDVVVIAGKGHEPYQIIGDDVLSFSDKNVAQKILEAHDEARS